MDDLIRIGNVSAVDPKTGMVAVTYEDNDDDTTGFMPFFAAGDEYKKPDVGEMVLVAHLSSGTTKGIVIGKIWNKANVPEKRNGWHKKIADDAFMSYTDKELHIRAPDIVLECDEGTFRLGSFLRREGE